MQLDIDFFKASELDSKMKCTIQKTGKLGFTESSIKRLNIDESKSIKIGKSSQDESNEVLYMVVVDGIDPDGFKVNKAGKYYYLNTKMLFQTLGFDYKKITIMFDIIEIEDNGRKIFKLIKREGKERQEI